MTPAELESWRQFHLLNPLDDQHRIYRPAALIAASMAGGSDAINKNLAWLQPQPPRVNFAEADLRTLAAFGLKPPRG